MVKDADDFEKVKKFAGCSGGPITKRSENRSSSGQSGHGYRSGDNRYQQMLITQNPADSTERATIQPRRRFLAGTVREPQINHASPTVEPADNDNDPSAEAEITPVASRPRRIVHVPRHLSADGDSPITPPSRRCTRRRQ
ncbi:hypothetical protein GHT06_013390 [Daphnia sinensis]|uniref:Uncharacterized protein n=1 Tax=Daphnia sinensis TaxID=1820382 RepID=A0AAD5KW17_9CRUS|nr:hypothetical protein GHT06_005445 [Daphnia sinensis]KAI9562420.1 hypothetical protein GHT06_013390 [Daphnia sinensis]